MAKKTKGDDAPNLHRLKAEYPEIHAALATGKIPSLRQALVLAGLKPERSRLEKLKNSWAKASDAERASFLAWLVSKGALSAPAAAPPEAGPQPVETPIASGRYLLPSTIAGIRTIMTQRGLKPADVMAEMGFPPDGRPLARALTRNASLRLSVIAGLEAWLSRNAGE
jgi:antitoxin component HigA of HigAB toxin-antitoxin module